MKVLVSTKRGQGDQPGDFSFAYDGELVYLGEVCDRDRADPDRGCGCGRAFVGLDTALGTTTAEVRRVNLTREQYTDRFRQARGDAGWGADNEPVEVLLGKVLDLTATLPVGTVVGRRLDKILTRNPS